MSERTLGKVGKNICWVFYLFLFYALLVAYISGIGNLSHTFFANAFHVSLPMWVAELFFVIVFGAIVFRGTRQVDVWNRILMFFKISFFLLIVLVGTRYVRPLLLARSDLSVALYSLPILVISFGFHNMIPSLTAYMNYDLKRVRKCIIGGGLFAFAIYLLWEAIVLGIVPLYGSNGLLESYKMDREGSQALSAILHSSWIGVCAQGLAFFAILTSFLTQSLSLAHFLADGFKISYKNKENLGMCALALIPPLIFSLIYPELFFKALNFAGGICAVVLFGILPVCMVWIGRYKKETVGPYEVRGGKKLLVGIFLAACFIFLFQLGTMLGFVSIPKSF